MNKKRFDIVILGSGSAAFAAAIKASELGATVAMKEQLKTKVLNAQGFGLYR